MYETFTLLKWKICESNAVVDVFPCVPVIPIILFSFDKFCKNSGREITFSLWWNFENFSESIGIALEYIYKLFLSYGTSNSENTTSIPSCLSKFVIYDFLWS